MSTTSNFLNHTFGYLNYLIQFRGDSSESFSRKLNDTSNANQYRIVTSARDSYLILGVLENQRLYFLNLLEHLLSRSKVINEACSIHLDTFDLYLSHQERHIESRLRDLHLEIFGEYSKLLLKAKECEDLVAHNFYQNLLFSTWNYQWNLFAAQFFAPLLLASPISPAGENKRIVLLDFDKDRVELKTVCDTNPDFRRELIDSYPIIGFKIVPPENARLSFPLNSSLISAETCNQLYKLFQLILNSAEKKQSKTVITEFLLTISSASIISPSYAISSLLWNELANYYYQIKHPIISELQADQFEEVLSLEQLSLAFHVQHTSSFFNYNVYFCLEECFVKEKSFPGSLLVNVLLTVYLDSPKLSKIELDGIFQAEPFVFDRFDSKHRSSSIVNSVTKEESVKRDLFIYPDIVIARSIKTNTLLHFAPMTVPHYQQLFQKSRENCLDGGANPLSMFFFTYYSNVLMPRKSLTSFANGASSTFSSTLIDFFSRASSFLSQIHEENAEFGFSRLTPRSPVPILMRMRDRCGEILLEETKFPLHYVPDHPRDSHYVSHSSSSSTEKLDCKYFFFQDLATGLLYFFQTLPKKTNLFDVNQGITTETNSDFPLYFWEQNLFLNCILRINSFEWLQPTSFVPKFQKLTRRRPIIDNCRRCDWRSCLSGRILESNSPRSVNLCQFHRVLKEFVDQCMNQRTNQKNSSKFLPRVLKDSIPSDCPIVSTGGGAGLQSMKRDLKVFKSSSSLLLEIWDGKLKNTIQTFLKKTENELTLRSFLELVNNNHSMFALQSHFPFLLSNGTNRSYQHISPPWIVWRDKDRLNRTLQSLQSNIDVLSSILTSEKFVTREIRHFFDLNCFPQQEVILIKKEMKQFKEFQQKLLQDTEIASSSPFTTSVNGGENGNEPTVTTDKNSAQDPLQMIQLSHDLLYQILFEENKLLDRKLLHLSQRRQTEYEARQTFLKKMLKLKAMEESELKDPSSFKNQFSR